MKFKEQPRIGKERRWKCGEKQITEVDGVFTTSEHQCFIPGIFASFDIAVRSFDLDDAQIKALQKIANARPENERAIRSLNPRYA